MPEEAPVVLPEFLEETVPPLESFFPFETPRPAQKLAMERIQKAVAKKKKYIINELPTGVGKSPLGIAVARWATRLPIEEFRLGAYILTTQKTLQAQYVRDHAERTGLVELKGQQNYPCEKVSGDCSVGSKLTASLGKCEFCPYREAKDTFCRMPYGVTNFSYFLTEGQHGGQLKPRNFLIVDECHNTEKEILSFADIEFTQARSDTCAAGLLPHLRLGPKQDWNIQFNTQARDWLEKTFLPASVQYMGALELEQQHYEQDGEMDNAAKAAKKLNGWKMFDSKVKQFVIANDMNDWISFSDQKSGNMIIRPLTATLFAEKILFSRAEHVLMMSATILDPNTFARNLGMDPTTCSYLTVPSDFPKENRPIYYKPQGSMSWASKAETLPKMIRFVERILTRYKDVKGMIHTNSYDINDALTQYLYTTQHASRIITHGRGPGSRDDAVVAHMMEKGPTVLVSPSMTEGLDLKEDLSRFQIIMKIPYPYLDPYTRTRMRRDEDWYQWMTALALIQASGRSNRSATDRANTFILDSAFEQFLNRNEKILPKWWTDAIVF